MNPEKWEQLKGLFAAALDRDPAQRSEFVDKACGDDQALRAELEQMLGVFEANQSVVPDEPEESDALAGQRIGPYQLIHKIGAGGMGAVYLAARADDAFNKRVAIKLVRADIDAQAVLRRFKQERLILAPLDHPNITRLLDGGTTAQGLPYFVMDYVEGTRIDRFCDNHKLSISDRIKLFQQVCSAVQYVHQNLVVHRDLKPGNILVTAEGVPKLLDFGIAKLLKPEFFASALEATMAEFRPMTPGYASPEQMRGEPVTTASDIYSLGVILYELLTSSRPYKVKADTPEAIRQAVCEQEPDKPSATLGHFGKAIVPGAAADPAKPQDTNTTLEAVAALRATVPEKLRRALEGDLDVIVLKALRKEPQRRYASAEQFSEDLRRHLEGLPVMAHKDSRSYRAGKFIRRHKVGVAAASLIVLSLIAGVLGTTWQMGVARRERARAEQQFDDVRKLTTSFLFEFHKAIEHLPGSTPARQLLVQRALEYLSKLASQHLDNPALQRELAEAYLKVGDVQGNPYSSNLGDTQGAAQSYQKALDISQALVRANPKDTDARNYLARSYKALGDVLAHLGRPTEAAADLRQAISILEPLASAQRNNETSFELANTYEELADLLGHPGQPNLGDSAGAMDNYRKALAIDDALVASDPGNRRFRTGDSVVQMRVGDMKAAQDDLNGAMDAYRKCIDSFQAVSAAAPNDAAARRRLAFGYRKVAGVQMSLSQNKDALQNYEKAGAIIEELLAADPANFQARMDTVVIARDMGDLLDQMKDKHGAVLHYQKATDALAALKAADPDNLMASERYAEMLMILGGEQAHAGQPAARANASRGLALTRELAARSDVTADALSEYAVHFLEAEPKDLRDPSTALQYAKMSADKGGTGPEYLDVLARAYFESGDSKNAIATAEKALSSLPPADPKQPASPLRERLQKSLARFKGAKQD